MYAVYLICCFLPEPDSVMLNMEAVHSSDTSQQTLTIEYEHLSFEQQSVRKSENPYFNFCLIHVGVSGLLILLLLIL
jgi:hypothetical protein